MDKESLIELTNKVYRLTLLFPKKEPLRYKIREVADELLADWITWETLQDASFGKPNNKTKEIIFELENNTKLIDGYLEISKWQDWASFFDVLEIQQEYDKIHFRIKEEIEKPAKQEGLFQTLELIPEIQKPVHNMELVVNLDEELDQRKGKIMDYLKENGKVQVWEMNKVLPGVSKRTLRRDFHYLLEKGLIERMGDKNDTFYQLS